MIDKQEKKVAKLNYNQDTFIEDFFQYLQCGEENIPIDIVNVKISTIDFMYVPFYIYKFDASLEVSALIGKDYTKWETEKTGRTKIEYEKDFFGNTNRYLVEEEITVANTYTSWKQEDFHVLEEKEIAFCANKHISSFIEDGIYNMNFNDFTQNPENIRTISIDKDAIETQAVNTELEKSIKNKAYAELKKMGDHYKNERIFNQNIKKQTRLLLVPIGYIEYCYNDEYYYFIKSLTDNKIFKNSIPKDFEFLIKILQGRTTCIFLFFIYVFLGFLFYKLTSIINLPYKNIIQGLIILILCLDYFSIYSCFSTYKSVNIEKRHNYIAELFKINHEKLKNLVICLDKPYKGYDK